MRRVVDDPVNGGITRTTFIDGEKVGLVLLVRGGYDEALNFLCKNTYGK